MILLPSDEAKGFDELSIMAVKILKQPTAINIENHKIQEDAIKREIGYFKYEDITTSEEYIEMCRVNLGLFDHIDDVKTKVLTQEDLKSTDTYNYRRFLCKKKLQERFFPASPLREQKIGYENIKA